MSGSEDDHGRLTRRLGRSHGLSLDNRDSLFELKTRRSGAWLFDIFGTRGLSGVTVRPESPTPESKVES